MSNLRKKALIVLAVPFAKDVLFKLATKATSTILNKFERKTSRKGVVRARKDLLYLFKMNDIIKIVLSLGKSGLLTDGATETVKNEKRNKKVDFLGIWCHLWLLHW